MEASRRDELTQVFPFFATLPPRTREAVLGQAVTKKLSHKEVLVRTGGECLYLPFVLEGTLRLYKTSPGGREITLYRIEKGESCILSATCILTQGSFPAVAEAEGETEILLVPSRLMADAVDESRKTVTVYVVAFMPGRCGAVGGFDWFLSPFSAAARLSEHMAEDENLEGDYVIRSVQVPVASAKTREAVTAWIDGDGFDLWNLPISGEESPVPSVPKTERGRKIAWLEHEIHAQKEWIARCGGDVQGYVENYGSKDEPGHSGNGGEAIYEADAQQLAGLEKRLAELKGVTS